LREKCKTNKKENMANNTTTNLSVENSIELFLSHYKYGKNYSDSTVLIDPAYNIIAFFDRGTANIDSIQAELPFNSLFIIENWKTIKTEGNIKYEPYDYEMAMKQNHAVINTLKQRGNKKGLENFYIKMRKEIEEYNINYFHNLSFNNLILWN